MKLDFLKSAVVHTPKRGHCIAILLDDTILRASGYMSLAEATALLRTSSCKLLYTNSQYIKDVLQSRKEKANA